MTQILLVCEDDKKIKLFEGALQKSSHELLHASNQEIVLDIIKTQKPDIVVMDTDIETLDLKIVNNKIKSFSDSILTILITKGENIDSELSKTANAFLVQPLSKEVLNATISANLRAKNSLEKLSDSNQELARSLYQLNVLYSTSSQFAGTLDKSKLIDYLIEGLDKSLSFGLSCVLTFRSESEPVLIINSLYQVSDRLLEALKLRTVLNYKSLFDKKEIPFELDIEKIKVEKYIKHPLIEYDFSVLRYDNMFAPISLSENFFGFIEIYRETEYTTEDATCFQTLAQQVSLPLKSASLYEQIKKTNQQLERLERLKSEFISIVSHELRTPLTAIKNSLDILLSGKTGVLSESMDKFVNMAKRNVVRLSGIINDLLDLSKIEAGKMDFKFDLVKIEPVIEYVKSSLMVMAKEKNIKLKTQINDNQADIFADSRRLEQVLTNLVSNAIKFTQDGGEIVIGSSIVDASEVKFDECFEADLKKLSGKYLKISVKDNGIGIAKEDLKRVFDQFAQIENSLSRKVGGSGLGLPIARQLLEAHNGAIWCESAVGEGSSFNFVIPLADEKNNFIIGFKQTLQKAKVNKTPVAMIKIKGEKELVKDLIDNKNLLSKTFLDNSIQEQIENTTDLTMIIPDGDKFSADFLKKKLEAYLKDRGNLYPNCAIMYSYAIYPEDAIDEGDLIKKAQDTMMHIKVG